MTVLSLLRVGDLLMQVPLLRALRREHPDAHLSLVVNNGVERARDLIPEVDSWIVFDRAGLQASLGTAEYHLLRPLREIQGWMLDSFPEPADVLYNFTHNRLSAHLAAAIPARMKFGLRAEGARFAPLENEWMRYLNERFSSDRACLFHYVDLLAGAFDLEVESPMPAESKGRRILLQTTTSTAEKERSPEFWRQLLKRGQEARPDLQWSVLCAPFEVERLSRTFDPKDLLVQGWRELQGTLRETHLLVTLDTSVKHLAALEGVPSFEIGVGSTNPQRTGAYGRGHFFASAKLADETLIDLVLDAVAGRRMLQAQRSDFDAWGYTLACADYGVREHEVERMYWGSLLSGEPRQSAGLIGHDMMRAARTQLEDAASLYGQIKLNVDASLNELRAGRPCESQVILLKNALARTALLPQPIRELFTEVTALAEVGAPNVLGYLGMVVHSMNILAGRLSVRSQFFGLNEKGESRHDRDGNLSEHGPTAS